MLSKIAIVHMVSSIGKEMILRRYYGPRGDLLSSNVGVNQAASDMHDDRGFLNMAISHLQNHHQTEDIPKGDEPTSVIITDAEINSSTAQHKLSLNKDKHETIGSTKR